MNILVRYDTPDENEETRRQRNERFNVESPELIIPTGGEYFWQTFITLNKRISRIRDSACHPLPPTEVESWYRMQRRVVSLFEYDILCEMDDAFCEEMNKELKAYNERMKEQNKQGAAPAPRRKR